MVGGDPFGDQLSGRDCWSGVIQGERQVHRHCARTRLRSSVTRVTAWDMVRGSSDRLAVGLGQQEGGGSSCEFVGAGVDLGSGRRRFRRGRPGRRGGVPTPVPGPACCTPAAAAGPPAAARVRAAPPGRRPGPGARRGPRRGGPGPGGTASAGSAVAAGTAARPIGRSATATASPGSTPPVPGGVRQTCGDRPVTSGAAFSSPATSAVATRVAATCRTSSHRRIAHPPHSRPSSAGRSVHSPAGVRIVAWPSVRVSPAVTVARCLSDSPGTGAGLSR